MPMMLIRPIASGKSWREGWRETLKNTFNRLSVLSRSIPVGAMETRVRFPFQAYQLKFKEHTAAAFPPLQFPSRHFSLLPTCFVQSHGLHLPMRQ